MDHPHPLADPSPDRAEIRLQESGAATPALSSAGSPSVCAEFERYDIAVVLQAIYQWGGYRYTNASDAIAAAKRGVK